MKTNIGGSGWEPRRTRRCCRASKAEHRIQRWSALALALLLATFASARAERINHEGRILGPAPVVTTSILFNTLQGDAITSAMQIFPVTNAWNENISQRPLLANSAAMI